jgi:multiple sugar transport system permease protein
MPSNVHARNSRSVRQRSRRWIEALTGYLLVSPAVTTLFVFVFGPVMAVALFSLSSWELGGDTFTLSGLQNYQALFSDRLFWISLGNTLLYAAIVVPGSIVLGLGIALVIEASPGGRSLYQTIHFLPVLATMAAMALSWEVILHPYIGVLNAVLGFFGVPPQAWLSDPRLVMFSLAMIGVWQNAGFCMALFIAGLRTIPDELYEASDIDGADGLWDRLSTVIWPLLGPVTLFVFVLVAIRAFEVFDTVAMLTQGRPGSSSQVLMYTIYSEGFRFLRTGYASALTVVFLSVLFLLTFLQMRLGGRRVHYT